MEKNFDELNVQELWQMMLDDGEYTLGFIESWGSDGYSGQGWVHKTGERGSFPAHDPKLMAEYLRGKAS